MYSPYLFIYAILMGGNTLHVEGCTTGPPLPGGIPTLTACCRLRTGSENANMTMKNLLKIPSNCLHPASFFIEQPTCTRPSIHNRQPATLLFIPTMGPRDRLLRKAFIHSNDLMCQRKATPSEIMEYGRWRKKRASLDMPTTYYESRVPSPRNRISLTPSHSLFFACEGGRGKPSCRGGEVFLSVGKARRFA